MNSLFVYAAGCEVNGAATLGCIEPIFGNLIKSVVALAVVAFFVMLLVGGFKFIIAGGDAKQLDQAKGTMTSAVLGIAVIAVSYLILQLIETVTGTPVTIFKIQ